MKSNSKNSKGLIRLDLDALDAVVIALVCGVAAFDVSIQAAFVCVAFIAFACAKKMQPRIEVSETKVDVETKAKVEALEKQVADFENKFKLLNIGQRIR